MASPSLRAKIDVAVLYAKALRNVRRRVAGAPPRPLPDPCPFTTDDLLAEDAEPDALLAKLGAPPAG